MATGKGRGTGNSNTRAPTPTAKTRTSVRNTVSLLLTKEEILNQEYDVKDKQSGETFLEKSPFRQAGEQITQENLILTILHITQYPGIPRIVNEGLRAVSCLLEKEAEGPTANNSTIKEVTNTLTTTLTQHVIAAISPQIAAMLTASETMKKNAEDIMQYKDAISENHQTNQDKATAAATRAEHAAGLVLNSIKEVKNAIDILTPSLSATQSSIKTISQTITDKSAQLPDGQPENTRTYSAAVQLQKTQLPAPVSAALTRAALKDRQILLEPMIGSKLYEPNDNPAVIAKKMKQVFSSAQTTDSPDIQIKATTRLRNGGLIIELTTAEAANWIRIPENRLKIIDALDAPALIKERRYTIIIPFLPIALDIEDAEWRREIEIENEMTTGAIEAAGWIKPRLRRSPGQIVAHATLHFTDPSAANISLRDGIYIGQEKFHPRKDKREPIRCVKCQLWGHMARDCNAPKDICGTCGKNHRTNDCNAYRTFHCVSCNSTNHASWDRNCPEFENRCAGLDAKIPENSMPYFPTNDVWTQVMLPPKPAPYRKPVEQTPNDHRTTLHQTNLPFETRRSHGPPMRGAPPHFGHHSTRRFTPTGSNSIPISPRRGTENALTPPPPPPLPTPSSRNTNPTPPTTQPTPTPPHRHPTNPTSSNTSTPSSAPNPRTHTHDNV